MVKKIFWIIAAMYFVTSSVFFIYFSKHNGTNLKFIYPNTATIVRIKSGQAEHRTSEAKKISRFFYNKPLGYMQTYMDNIYRSLDIPFLFTLSTDSSMYNNKGPRQMLFPLELIFFVFAFITIIRSKNNTYILFFWYFLLVLLTSAFFLPSINQIKLLPEVMGIRLFIIFGVYEGLKKWLKK